MSTSLRPSVVVLDYGSGNLRSVQRALERVGANVEITSDATSAASCDGLVVPGVGAYASCMAGLTAIRGESIIDARLAGGRPVLGICVGLQILFSSGVEHGTRTAGLGQWPGTVERLSAPVLPHMGWNTVDVGEGSTLFAGVESERFYFVHSYGVVSWDFREDAQPVMKPPVASWCTYTDRFVAAVENGPLVATQFHPEKSGDTGAYILGNWLATLR
jgi:glutamine amidotransferase